MYAWQILTKIDDEGMPHVVRFVHASLWQIYASGQLVVREGART